MGAVKARPRPTPEAVVYDGSNADEVFDLVARVAALDVWSVLPPDAVLTYEERDTEPHLGVNVATSDGEVVARVEEGNVLVFDPFAETPLFVLGPEAFDAFYERA